MSQMKERSFGQALRDRRRQLDLTPEEVAHRIKTSTLFVKHLESGKRHPSDKVVTRLAEVLRLDRRELFFLANPRARALLRPDPETGRIRDISDDEMETLSRKALLGQVKELQEQGRLPIWPTNEQRADWAYGNTVIENAKVTLEMAKRAVTKKPSPA